MSRSAVQLLGIFSFIALAGCAGGSVATTPTAALSNANAPAASVPQANVIASCGTLLPGDDATCFALQRTDVGEAAAVYFPGARNVLAATAAGYGPTDIRSAYALPNTGSGQTVGIVDAYDDPKAEADLATYRARYGLTVCSTANGCFLKLNQNGVQGLYPPANSGWGQEISLDLDMVSATCPNCKIVLVEASSATLSALGKAVNAAILAGATVVSNSYGGMEVNAKRADYAHPGHVIVASTGDYGYGAQQPASFATVVAAGGTSLARASNPRGWSETVWSGSGSGCSALVPKPAWQTDHGCANRSEADISAVADPYTGVAAYDSFGLRGQTGWLVFGGTSVASPIIASIYALAGNAATQNAAEGIWTDAGANTNDVTSGSNGTCPSTYTYLCVAGTGYDGPTGWGTPNGTAAF